ncbi:MAG: 50S ribosomal protein L25, partial [Candidatus Paceibacterota bacterium]
MAKKFTLKIQDRSEKPGVVRRNGFIPGILYGHNLKANKNIQVVSLEFSKVLREAGHSSLVTLDTEKDGQHTVIIRDVQLHPVKGNIVHADFYQVRLDQEITADIPLHFVGESPAVKDLGGVFIRNIDEIEVEALPQDLPPEIEVDISVLKDFDSIIHVSDLNLPKGVTALNEDEDVIALVQAPRTEAELEDLSTEVT